jgi:hypothetical protein
METCRGLWGVQVYKGNASVRWFYGVAYDTFYGSRSHVNVANAHTLVARIQYTDGKPI